MSQLNVDTIKKADGTGSLTVPAETGTVVTTASPSLGRRNLIINGAMQVAQRGTSFASLGNGSAFTLDRMKFVEEGTTDSRITVSQDTTSPDDLAYSLKVAVTTADTSLDAGHIQYIRYAFEGQEMQLINKGTASAKVMTLSFYVRSNKTGTYIVQCNHDDSSRFTSQSYTISSADTWERKTITIPADTTGTIVNDNTNGLELQFHLSAGSDKTSGTLQTTWGSATQANRAVGQTNLMDSTSNTFYITGVQLEVGSVATPFEHRSYGEELALCQRYTQVIDVDNDRIPAFTGANPDHVFTGNMLVKTMRAQPSLSTSNTLTYDNYYIGTYHQSSAALYRNSGANNFIIADCSNFSGLTYNSAGCIRSSTSALITLDAEL